MTMRGLVMINVFIDLETLPEPNAINSYIEAVKGNIKAPKELTKPKLIEALGLGDQGKYKTVPELQELWVSKFGAEQEKVQGEQDWRKTSFNGAKGQICVIGVKVEGDKFGTAFYQDDQFSEREILSKFWAWLDLSVGNHQWRFVAHNAKFDLPFLFHRSVINQVKPLRYNPHGRHGQYHYCTMEAWSGFGGKISMDNLASALGIEGKGDMDGSKVYDTWQTDPQKVIDYCLDDVHMLEQIYNRLEFV